MSQWGWSVPSWVNNYHSDFWLGMCPWSQKMGDSSAAVVAFRLCQPYCINARWSLGKISMWGFQLITQKCVLVDNWICVIWITVDHNNISEQLKIQYKLFNGMCKLKYGRIGLKFAFISRLSKSLQDAHALNVHSRSPKFGPKLH